MLTQQEPRLLLKAREAAKALNVSERTLYGWTRRGLVRAVRVGRTLRYAPAELARFIETQTAGGER